MIVKLFASVSSLTLLGASLDLKRCSPPVKDVCMPGTAIRRQEHDDEAFDALPIISASIPKALGFETED